MAGKTVQKKRLWSDSTAATEQPASRLAAGRAHMTTTAADATTIRPARIITRTPTRTEHQVAGQTFREQVRMWARERQQNATRSTPGGPGSAARLQPRPQGARHHRGQEHPGGRRPAPLINTSADRSSRFPTGRRFSRSGHRHQAHGQSLTGQSAFRPWLTDATRMQPMFLFRSRFWVT